MSGRLCNPYLGGPTGAHDHGLRLLAMTSTISSQYPPEAPLLFGQPDGNVRPARMVARSHGARTGMVVWVTGDGVEEQEGRLIELLEGEVLLEQVGQQGTRQAVPLEAAALSRRDLDDPNVVMDDRAHPAIPRSDDVLRADVAMAAIGNPQHAPVYTEVYRSDRPPATENAEAADAETLGDAGEGEVSPGGSAQPGSGDPEGAEAGPDVTAAGPASRSRGRKPTAKD